MRYLLFLIAIFALTVLPVYAITGDNARFDFTNGQPTITDNTSSTCNNQAVVRYDFTNGQPTIVYDTTATCAAVVVPEPYAPSDSRFDIVNGLVSLQQGVLSIP